MRRPTNAWDLTRGDPLVPGLKGVVEREEDALSDPARLTVAVRVRRPARAARVVTTIPARRGKAAHVRKGQHVRVINTHGTQVVDTWAFNADDVTEWMAMEASRAWFLKLAASVGDSFVTNRRRPILTLVEDTSACAHDTLMAPCDPDRYGLLGVKGYHDNCRDNLHAALAEPGIKLPATPPS